MACPASVTLTRGIERPSSPYAREGTAAHTLAEMLLRGHAAPSVIHVEGEAIEVTEEMLAHVGVYTQLVDMLRATADLALIEERLSLDWYYEPDPPPEPIFGTADFVSFDARQSLLTVVDLKYGQGHAVEAADNPQLMIYALMALGVLEADYPVKVQMAIVQPRVKDPVRSHTILLSELIKWADTKLRPALTRIGAGDTSENPGDWCRWCVRAGTCSALTQTAIESAKLSFGSSNSTPQSPKPEDLSSEDLGSILEKAELISGWVTKVRLEVETRIKNGEAVPGWKLVQKRATRKWGDEAAAEEVFHNLYGDAVFSRDLLSPAQMEKLIKKNKDDLSLMDGLVVKESSGTTLARADDAREGIESSPSSVFTPLVGFDG